MTRQSFSGRDMRLCNPHTSVSKGVFQKVHYPTFLPRALYSDSKCACKPCLEEDQYGCLKNICLGDGEGALQQGQGPSVTPELFRSTSPSEQTEGLATKPFTCPSYTERELFYIVGTT